MFNHSLLWQILPMRVYSLQSVMAGPIQTQSQGSHFYKEIYKALVDCMSYGKGELSQFLPLNVELTLKKS